MQKVSEKAKKSLLLETSVLLKRQHLLTCHLIKNQTSALQEFENAVSQHTQAIEHVLAVYNFVFALIDNLVRYQKIALSLPMISHKKPEFRALNEAMGGLKDMRNQVQHINNDIDNNYSGPLLGSISWISKKKHFTAVFFDVAKKRTSPGLVFDVQKRRFLNDFCYVYNNIYYDLDKAINGMHEFQKWVSSIIKIEVNGKPYDIDNQFAAICMEVNLEKVG
jgi:hypothetical protein